MNRKVTAPLRALLVALIGGLLLAILATTPPRPLTTAAPETVFSAKRAMADVRVIASKPHPTGTAENAAVRDYIAAKMRALGMEVAEDRAVLGPKPTAIRNRWSGRDDPPQSLVNLIGVLPGKDRSLPALMLMSHHDTVWGSPGASDDTAGVAASLEVIRALKTGGQPGRDIVMLATDAEELGLEGAEHFFAAHPLRARIGAIINMEARGGGGRTTLFQTSRENGAAVALYADAVRRPGASSLATFIYSVLPNDTDLTPALQGPYTAYNFAFIGRSGLYHSPAITPDLLDQGALQDMGQQVLDLARALSGPAPLPAKAPDLVFFDLFGLTTITYPQGAGWLLLALAVLGLGYAGRGTPWRDSLAGAGRSLALIAASAGLLHLLNTVSIGPEQPNYYDRLAEIPRLELMALYAVVAASLLAFAGWRARPGNVSGAALPLVLLGALAQWFAPTAAYILLVPAALAALGQAAARRWPGAVSQWLGVAVAALVLGYMLGLGHQLMQGVGPSMPWIAALPLAIALAALAPMFPAMPVRRGLLAAGLFALAGLVTALAIRSDSLADTVAVYSTDKPAAVNPISKPG